MSSSYKQWVNRYVYCNVGQPDLVFIYFFLRQNIILPVGFQPPTGSLANLIEAPEQDCLINNSHTSHFPMLSSMLLTPRLSRIQTQKPGSSLISLSCSIPTPSIFTKVPPATPLVSAFYFHVYLLLLLTPLLCRVLPTPQVCPGTATPSQELPDWSWASGFCPHQLSGTPPPRYHNGLFQGHLQTQFVFAALSNAVSKLSPQSYFSLSLCTNLIPCSHPCPFLSVYMPRFR